MRHDTGLDRGLDPRLDTALAAAVAAFGDWLHRAGVPVTPDRSARWAAAIDEVPPGTTAELYWLARVTLVSDRSHIPTFDAVFDQVFRGFVDDASRGDPGAAPIAPAAIEAGSSAPHRDRSPATASSPSRRQRHVPGRGGDEGDASSTTLGMTASADERLRRADFAACTPDELATIVRLIGELVIRPPVRTTRRTRRHRAGDCHDLRATLRHARRTAGEPIVLATRRAGDERRRVVLLADVSGSMQHYARAYLALLHAAVRSLDAEAFVMSTHLQRVTIPLRHPAPDIALGRAVQRADDYSGGTRLGECIGAFLDGWGRRGLARGAVVVVLSDGWDAGDPALLGTQMERLARLAHRIVWVNPRLQSDRYEPLVGGMRAALDHVDRFVSGHSVDAMLDVIAAIGER
jgi:hypothetical protein